ncbi:Gfo/Idh/MocA family protein [Hoeflea prorocentri]|uniref:Gfo/Idh/MocA family oxidoreductase n=1 Tax=Hoeflea prorocentri TaxID=1922333 RepID=A0A9X3ZI01_9HYPH|nr:Gfo/Idh/MocA family oxidoreductase [Hoeflea prorocentri]MCY6381899.1 Gfo/Idh/MocA family oxidoreductase [Hoeflea prorocentri]MDA5399699.1 Gfo/Idh/MocA family oxidoreductase [Hoeflea prorocentri]
MTAAAPIGVGLIGLGNSGWYYHAEGTLTRHPHYELVAVSSRTVERARAAAERFGAKAYDDWRALIDDPKVQLVVIATPHDLHLPMTLAAAAARKHIVVEKPMAKSTAETAEMMAAADNAGVVLSVFQNRRWEEQYQSILEVIRNGAIGDVWRVEERRMHRGKYVVAGAGSPHTGSDLAAWAHTTDGAGGVTYLISPHLIDHQIHLFGGAPLDVSAVMHTYPGDVVEHYVDIRMNFPGGGLSRIEVYREAVDELPAWVVSGDRGTIVGRDLRSLDIHRPGTPPELIRDLPVLRGCDAFYDGLFQAITEGAPPPVDPRDSAIGVRIIELAHKSARSGGARQEFSI